MEKTEKLSPREIDTKLEERLVKERGSTHGDWAVQSSCAASLKMIIERHDRRILKNERKLTPSQREALDMIATKMSRILCGNPYEEDHWKDIAGYAHLGNGGRSKGL